MGAEVFVVVASDAFVEFIFLSNVKIVLNIAEKFCPLRGLFFSLDVKIYFSHKL
jgi:hypothetical protein